VTTPLDGAPRVGERRAASSHLDHATQLPAGVIEILGMPDHTELDVYHRALDLLDLVDQVHEVMPPGRAHLKSTVP